MKSDMYLKPIPWLILILFLGLAVFAIQGCAPAPDPSVAVERFELEANNRSITEVTTILDGSYTYVTRFIDAEFNQVCYVVEKTHNNGGVSIDCIPLIQTGVDY